MKVQCISFQLEYVFVAMGSNILSKKEIYLHRYSLKIPNNNCRKYFPAVFFALWRFALFKA